MIERYLEKVREWVGHPDERSDDVDSEAPPEEGGDGWAADELGAVGTTLFFVGGFIFDALTIGRYVNLYTLGYVGIYAVGVGLCMVVRARRWFEPWRDWIDNALHFCLGAVFSALVCLYFRSAGHFWGFLGVAFLAGLMLYNEYAVYTRPRRSLIWAIYAASLVMYFNFLAPYLFRSLSEWWFYGSIAVTMATLYGLRHLANIPDHSLIASAGFAVVLVALYLFGAIPPVPLVMKQQIVGVDARKRGGEYVCDVGDRSIFADLGIVDPTVRYVDGEKVSVMSAVSAPTGVETEVAHRWKYWREDSWKAYDTIELEMRGGRDSGWRFFSHKRNVRPGYWKVETIIHGDALLSSTTFYLDEVETSQELGRRAVELK